MATENSIAIRVLIGPMTRDPSESVGKVNEAFIIGLRDRFEFVPHEARRSPGGTSAGSLNLGNSLVFIHHLASWLSCLARKRPYIAHYAITSHWNMEKSLFLLWLAQCVGCRTVGHLHGGMFIEFWGGAHPLRRRLASYILDRLDAFVVLSEGWKERTVATLGLSPDRVHVVYNPVDETFEQEALSFNFEHDTDATVLCFGVMDQNKGVFDILEAAALLPPEMKIRFLLVGPEREPGIIAKIRNLINDKGLENRVELTGPVHGDRKLELFRQASLFLLPSYVENFPVTVLESMAAGLPVICTAVGAVPEFLVDCESALFVKAASPHEIAAAIQRLMADADERKRIAEAAREVFLKRLQRSHIMAQMMAVYDEVGTIRNSSPELSQTRT